MLLLAHENVNSPGFGWAFQGLGSHFDLLPRQREFDVCQHEPYWRERIPRSKQRMCQRSCSLRARIRQDVSERLRNCHL